MWFDSRWALNATALLRPGRVTKDQSRRGSDVPPGERTARRPEGSELEVCVERSAEVWRPSSGENRRTTLGPLPPERPDKAERPGDELAGDDDLIPADLPDQPVFQLLRK